MSSMDATHSLSTNKPMMSSLPAADSSVKSDAVTAQSEVCIKTLPAHWLVVRSFFLKTMNSRFA